LSKCNVTSLTLNISKLDTDVTPNLNKTGISFSIALKAYKRHWNICRILFSPLFLL